MTICRIQSDSRLNFYWLHLVEPSSSSGGTSAQSSGSGAAELLDSFLLLKVMKCSRDKLMVNVWTSCCLLQTLHICFGTHHLVCLISEVLLCWETATPYPPTNYLDSWLFLDQFAGHPGPFCAQDFSLCPRAFWNGGMSVLLFGGFLTSFAAVFFLCGCDSSS